MFCFWKKNDPPKPADPQLLEAVKAYIEAHFVPEGASGASPEAAMGSHLAGSAAPMMAQDLETADDLMFEEVSIDADLSAYQQKSSPRVEYAKKKHAKFAKMEQASYSMPAPAAPPSYNEMPKGLDELLRKIDAGFSETLLKLIDETGEKDSDIYKRAHVDRKLFSKIRSNPDYRPSKSTAVAFALALRLDLEGTNELIGRAGYVLSHSSVADLIVECFIVNKNYDIDRLNEVLYAKDQPLIGGVA